MGIHDEVPGERYRSVLDPLNSLSDLITKLVMTPGLHSRASASVAETER